MTETVTPEITVGRFVHGRAESLQTRLIRDEPTAVATLARLRRGVGVAPGEHVELLPVTHHDAFVPGYGDDPSREEWAVHTALALFAAHQQSQDRRMHVAGVGLGSALLSLGGPAAPAVARRFAVLGTSEEFAEMTHHLRGVVQLLRQGRRPLDYGRLADDLLSWQFPPHGPARVRLRWGREFYRTPDPAGSTRDTDTQGTDTEGEIEA